MGEGITDAADLPLKTFMNAKAILKGAVARALPLSAIPLLIRLMFARRGCGILIYHDPKPETLDRHLQYLKRHFSFISLSKLCDAIEARDKSTLSGGKLVLTIDDGHAGTARLIPIFRKHAVYPTIYVCSSIVGTEQIFWWQHEAVQVLGLKRLKRLPNAERLRLLARYGFMRELEQKSRSALSREEVTALAAVADIQSHTRSHPILTQCDDDTCSAEITGSKSEIEAFTGKLCVDFAYPNGNYGAREIAILKDAGYRSARTCDAGWNGAATDLFQLRGIPIADDASVPWISVQVTGLSTFLKYAFRGSWRGRMPQY
jgi:peptidoglycan/xylan/chitin deacetylase (PgdA/CDA1 family)